MNEYLQICNHKFLVFMMSLFYLFLLTEFVVGCPSCYLSYARQLLPSHVSLAAQNCYKVRILSRLVETYITPSYVLFSFPPCGDHCLFHAKYIFLT